MNLSMCRVLVMLCSCAGLAACGTKIEPGGDCPLATVPVTYSANIQSFLSTNCTGCHSSTVSNRSGAPAGINFDTYDAARDNGVQADQDILGGRMPPGATLDPNTQCMFDAWVKGGYLE